jgi:chromosomal replication initiation ATPase DnaA
MNPMIYVGTLKKYSKESGELNKTIILKTICEHLEMNFEDVKNRKTRLRKYAYARHIFAYFCRIYTKDSFSIIGKFIKKNHATILHSNKQIIGWLEFDELVKNDVKKITTQLNLKFVKTIKKERDLIAEEIILKYQN